MPADTRKVRLTAPGLVTHAAIRSNIQGPAIVLPGQIGRVRAELLALADAALTAHSSPNLVTKAVHPCAR